VLGLDSMKRLMEKLGNVQNALPIIHIAGTNGKGSTGAYLESLFRCAGLSVGRYTSPAVFDEMEIFRYNDEYMTMEIYRVLMDEIRIACLELPKAQWPTIFEAETALAFLWFSRIKPDVVLLECGMGGETDATNVIGQSMAAVFTAISLDHLRFLGDTVGQIAGVKSKIIKRGSLVFSADQDASVSEVLQAEAKVMDCEYHEVNRSDLSLQRESVGQLFFTYRFKDLQLGLFSSMSGHYQMMNAALAIEVFDRVMDCYFAELEMDRLRVISDGIAMAKWPGRFEVVSCNPLIVLDGAHNEGAALELDKTLMNCFLGEKVDVILGVLADKDYCRMLQILAPHIHSLVTITPPNNPRAMDGERLADVARGILCDCQNDYEEDVVVRYEDSLAKALQFAGKNGKPILVCGSLSFLRAAKEEIYRYLDAIGKE